MDVAPKYSIVLPVYNEEITLPELYRRLEQVLVTLDGEAEIIFVNDGSQDKSLSILEEFSQQNSRIKIIEFSRNFGHQAAITAGLDYASGQACIIMDTDLQDPPEVIPDLIKSWQQGYEVVYAVRSRRKGETWFKKATAALFYRLLKQLTNTDIPINVGDFRLMDQKVVKVFCTLRERHRFVRGLVSWLGFRQTGVYYQREPRFAGETKYPFWRMFKFALDGITSFSYRPLQLATLLGFLFSIISFLLGFWAVWLKLLTDRTIPGWTSLMVSVLFLGGIQLITLGIIGEYVGRISDDVKRRPLYVIRSKTGFTSKAPRSLGS